MHILRAKKRISLLSHTGLICSGIFQLERTEAGKVVAVKGQVWDSSDTTPRWVGHQPPQPGGLGFGGKDEGDTSHHLQGSKEALPAS